MSRSLLSFLVCSLCLLVVLSSAEPSVDPKKSPSVRTIELMQAILANPTSAGTFVDTFVTVAQRAQQIISAVVLCSEVAEYMHPDVAREQVWQGLLANIKKTGQFEQAAAEAGGEGEGGAASAAPPAFYHDFNACTKQLTHNIVTPKA